MTILEHIKWKNVILGNGIQNEINLKLSTTNLGKNKNTSKTGYQGY